MDKIRKILEDPLQVALAVSGVGLVGFYLFYARNRIFGKQKKKQPNTLQIGLKQLVRHKSGKNICKIVITESPNNRLPFTGTLITKLKQFLLSQQQNILVNCSPLKLFNASVQIFVSTLSKQDPEDEREFMSYLENALQCQLLIERTVIDIEQIRNKESKAYLICDTNSLDLKAQTDQELWNKFLIKQEITEQELRDNYQIVFHVLSADYTVSPKIGGRKKSINKQKIPVKSDDDKIKEAWAGFKNYYVITYNPELDLEENVNISIGKMIDHLRPFLVPAITFHKPPHSSQNL